MRISMTGLMLGIIGIIVLAGVLVILRFNIVEDMGSKTTSMIRNDSGIDAGIGTGTNGDITGTNIIQRSTEPDVEPVIAVIANDSANANPATADLGLNESEILNSTQNSNASDNSSNSSDTQSSGIIINRHSGSHGGGGGGSSSDTQNNPPVTNPPVTNPVQDNTSINTTCTPESISATCNAKSCGIILNNCNQSVTCDLSTTCYACTANSQCDDSNPLTDDVCSAAPRRCVHTPIIPPQNNQSGDSSNGVLCGKSYLIHDQEFVMPSNAIKGDTPGILSNYWNKWYNVDTKYAIEGAANGFTIDNSGKLSLSDTSGIAGKRSVQLTIKATNAKTLETSTAKIIINILPAADTRFIDPTVQSSGDGSRDKPFKSWSDVTIDAGKYYLQKRGTTDTLTDSITDIRKDNVILGSYGSATARPKIVAPNIGYIVDVVSDNVVVRDLDIDGSLSSSGVKFSGYYQDYSIGSHNVTVDNCKIQHTTWGVRIFDNDGVRVLNSEIAYIGDDGIFLQNKRNAEIAYNYIHDVNQKYLSTSAWCRKDHPNDPSSCQLQNYSGGDGIQMYADDSSGHSVTGYYIHHNIIDHSSTGNKFCIIVHGVSSGADKGRIENNYLKRAANNGDIGVYLENDIGDVIRYNTFENSAIFAHAEGMTISYNLFYQGNTLFLFKAPSTKSSAMSIHNNIFYNPRYSEGWSGGNNVHALIYMDYNLPFSIKNNIFYLDDTTVSKVFEGPNSGITYSNNDYYPAMLSADAKRDTSPILSNPSFMDAANKDFRLKSNSPMFNAGANVEETRDYYGNIITSGGQVSIGIYNGAAK